MDWEVVEENLEERLVYWYECIRIGLLVSVIIRYMTQEMINLFGHKRKTNIFMMLL